MILYYKSALETAFERISTAGYWKDPEAALARAIKARDELIDDCQIYCKKTGHRMEDIFDLPR